MTDGALPSHIAFIMDGNGRWARERLFSRIRGHETGADVLRTVTEYCCEIGVSEITFFALSTENFRRRPTTEINALLRLLKKYLVQERPTIAKNGIRFRFIGQTEDLPEGVQRELRISEEQSVGNNGMILRLALNYGSRQEILDGLRAIVADLETGRLDHEKLRTLDEEGLRPYLYDPEMSDPDLLIRTAGEFRISNFLLWQLSYTELFFCPDPWPDFTLDHLREAISIYQGRERKFGSLERTSTRGKGGLD